MSSATPDINIIAIQKLSRKIFKKHFIYIASATPYIINISEVTLGINILEI